MSERQRLAALALCLVLVVVWISWGTFRGHEQRCFYAVTIGQHKSGYQEVPCNASAKEQIKHSVYYPNDLRPGAP